MNKRVNFNLSGHQFGKLFVLRFTEIANGRAIYQCRCDCGAVVTVKAKYLLNGDTKSCGCLKKETASANGKARITHGKTKHPLFKVWDSMKDRCLNPRCHAYKDYGGRGITISKEWVNSFQTFYDDVVSGYKKGLELDRTDNESGYSKDNFRWATRTENIRNRRTSIFLTINGVKKHIFQWSEDTGIPVASIRSRIAKGKEGADALYGCYQQKKNRRNA